MALSYRGGRTKNHSYKESQAPTADQQQTHRAKIKAQNDLVVPKPQPEKVNKPVSIADYNYPAPVRHSSPSAGTTKKSSYPTGKARQARINECFRIIREQQELRKKN